jgi:hypothetical protein
MANCCIIDWAMKDPKREGSKTSKLFHSLGMPFTQTKPESCVWSQPCGNTENTFWTDSSHPPPSTHIPNIKDMVICVLICLLRPRIRCKSNIQTHDCTRQQGTVERSSIKGSRKIQGPQYLQSNTLSLLLSFTHTHTLTHCRVSHQKVSQKREQ